MKSVLLVTVSASVVALAVVACSSGGSGGGVGGGGAGGAGGACGAYFDSYTEYAKKCGGQFFNSRDRWVQYCQLLINAPGAGGADSAINQCAQDINAGTSACASATKSTACSTFMGALGSGAACGSSVQCASGFCKGGGVHSSTSSSGDSMNTATCGVCAAEIAVGQPCDQSKDDRCVKDASCSTTGSGSVGTCKANIVNDLGGACGGNDNITCKDGLRCDFMTMKCGTLAAVGGTCTFDSDCATPLVCGADMKCAQPKADGSECTAPMGGFGGTGCARNETCNANTCSAPTYGAPGAPCDYNTRFCKVGSCVVPASDGGITGTSMGKCPTVIPDGQACTNSSKDGVCDEFADCIGGKCGIFDPGTCK